MKIFYAFQATGNGHISRAIELYPHLQKFGEVDFFMSGNNSTLNPEIPIKYKSKGCSLYYSKCGGLNYGKIVQNIRPLQIYKDAKALPLKKYDIVINDFDAITSLACKIQKVNSVQFGHQASFISQRTPRPEKKSLMGEAILKHYASSTTNIGLHFESYDSFIHPPIIKKAIAEGNPNNLDHITVYLPSFNQYCLETAFNKVKDQHFHWFLPNVSFKHTVGNITYYPQNQQLFNYSLINCKGIITGGGFETPSEALYLKKKILCIPIKDHYEQECNAAALKKMGVTVVTEVKDDFNLVIERWLNSHKQLPHIVANNVEQTLESLFDNFNSMQKPTGEIESLNSLRRHQSLSHLLI